MRVILLTIFFYYLMCFKSSVIDLFYIQLDIVR